MHFYLANFLFGRRALWKKDQTKRKEDLLNLVFLSREYVVCLQIAIQWKSRRKGTQKTMKRKVHLLLYLEPIYRKVLNSGRGYYSFFHVLCAPTIQGRLLYKGAYYKRILFFTSKNAILKHF